MLGGGSSNGFRHRYWRQDGLGRELDTGSRVGTVFVCRRAGTATDKAAETWPPAKRHANQVSQRIDEARIAILRRSAKVTRYPMLFG